MATLKVAWNPSTMVATVQDNADTVPSGSTSLGTFTHSDEPNDAYDTDVSHVLYHHVRDILYTQGVFNMQAVTINSTVGS